MLISVLTPTRHRSGHLRLLYEDIKTQTHRDLEWIIADDSDAPDPFFAAATDPRVRYVHLPDRHSVGRKRNLLKSMARGEILAHADDDDHYAPGYLAAMGRGLDGAALAKLSAWFSCCMRSGDWYYWDTTRLDRLHHVVGRDAAGEFRHFDDDWRERKGQELCSGWTLGYGFSLVYRRSLALAVDFDEVDFAEDLAFAKAALADNQRIVLIKDHTGLAAHLLHGGNSSRIFPQHRLPEFLAAALFPGVQLEARRALTAPESSHQIPDHQEYRHVERRVHL